MSRFTESVVEESLTMAFYAGRIIREPAMANPTVVVLTDRNDLDDQLFGTFSRRSVCVAVRALGCLAVVAALFMLSSPPAAWADCASDCQASYRSCRGNPDSCLSAQGVCLNRCTLGGARERHGAIAYSAGKEIYGYSHDYDSASAARDAAVRNCRGQGRGADDCRVLVTFHNACGALALGDRGAYGSAWAMSGREASAKALTECRPHGGASCKIQREVCSGARR